jgi:glycosyltransferase involved in cell wall biosynthesis
LRILVVSDLPQFVTGGAEMQASRLIEAWLERGHEVICCGRRMRAGNVELGRHQIRTHRIYVFQHLGRPGRALSYFLSLSLLLLRYRTWPDVIYTRFLNEGAATAALLKQAGLLHCALVPTPANAGVNGDHAVLAALPFKRHLVRVLDRQCDAINLIAPAMSGELKTLGFSGANFQSIPNGIDIPPEVERSASTVLRLLFVGRLASQKGLDLLLDAISLSAVDQIELKIVGDGPERQALVRQAASLNLSNRVVFLGEQQQEEVQSLLCASDVFVLPSRYEGLSNAGLEAMAQGLPMLLTRCGGLDTYLDASSGWVVPAGDSAALAQILPQIVATPRDALLRMGRNARALAQRHFSMPEIAGHYLTLFESLLR